MPRRSGAILALFWILSAARASDRVEIRLVDEAGVPLVGVEIAQVGRGGSARTDADGRAALLGSPVPPFELVVFDARGAWLGVIAVPDEAALSRGEFVLTATLRETVTVVPSTAPHTAVPPAAAANVWSAEDRAESAPPRLTDVVEALPGATRVGNGPAAVPALRGMARGRTLILLDGGRVVSERRAGPSATFLDPFSLERVEVVRGLGSVAYGSDAMGGVIHARTAQPRPDAAGGRFEAALGFGQNRGSAALEWNQPAGTGAWLFQAHGRRSSDWESPTGEVLDSGAEDRGFLVRGAYPLGKGSLRFGLQRDVATDVGKPANNSDRRQTNYPRETSSRVSVSVELPGVASFETIEVQAVLGRYRLTTDRTELDDDPRTRERADVDAKDIQVRLDGSRGIPGGLLRTGVDVSSRFDLTADNLFFEETAPGRFEETARTAAIEDAGRWLAGAYVEAEGDGSGGRNGWAAGIRVDRVRTENRGGGSGDRSTGDTGLSGYAAYRRRFGDHWEGAVRLGRGFRDPGLSDRYFEGVTGRGLIVGEPGLEAERSTQWDASVTGKIGARTRLGLFGYRYRIDDLVERFEQPTQPDVFGYRNRGAATLEGFEMEWDTAVTQRTALRVTANVARGRLEDGTDADDVPAERVTASLRRSYDGGWWRLGIVAASRDASPGPNEIATPGYLDASGAVGWRWGERGEFRLLVENLFDRAYPESADDRTTLAPGRRAAVVWAGDF